MRDTKRISMFALSARISLSGGRVVAVVHKNRMNDVDPTTVKVIAGSGRWPCFLSHEYAGFSVKKPPRILLQVNTLPPERRAEPWRDELSSMMVLTLSCFMCVVITSWLCAITIKNYVFS